MASKKKIEILSPKGVAVYPRLKTPDTKFDELGSYNTNLAVDKDTAQPLIKRLQEIHKEAFGKAAPVSGNSMFQPEVDKETGEETGRVVFKFRAANKEIKKGKRAGEIWDRQPTLRDAKGNRILEYPNIGGGSVIKVFFEVYVRGPETPKPGISLQPLQIQLIELVEYKGGQEENPFEEEEGFTVEDGDNPFGTDDDETDASDGDDNKDF